MRHTPPPWRFRGFIQLEEFSDALRIVWPANRQSDICWLPAGPDVEANGRLIAAAPELLSLVERLDPATLPPGLRAKRAHILARLEGVPPPG